MPSRITVVTPSFNQAPFLEQTIRSVLDQGYPELEYMVVDGGSSDGSVEIIRRYADRLAWWVSEPDRGQAHAINKALARATGRYFCWMNSDDYYLPGALATLAEAIEARPECNVVAGAGRNVDRSGNPIGLFPPSAGRDGSWRRWNMPGGAALCQPASIISTAALRQAGGLDEHLHNLLDHDLWFRLRSGGGMAAIGQVIACNRVYDGNKTQSAVLRRVIEETWVTIRYEGANEGRDAFLWYWPDLCRHWGHPPQAFDLIPARHLISALARKFMRRATTALRMRR